MKEKKLKVLFPYVVGARTATSTNACGKLIKAPEDFEGIRFRTPGSKSLGVKIYTPTPQEKDVLAKTFGHTNPAWEPVKKRLLGNIGMAARI